MWNDTRYDLHFNWWIQVPSGYTQPLPKITKQQYLKKKPRGMLNVFSATTAG